MSAQNTPIDAHALRGYTVRPAAGGGWYLTLISSTRQGAHDLCDTRYFGADPTSDPTGEAAYARALDAAEDWRTESPPRDRRADHARRQIIARARLAEFESTRRLDDATGVRLTAAIDALIDLIRHTAPGTAPDDGPGTYTVVAEAP